MSDRDPCGPVVAGAWSSTDPGATVTVYIWTQVTQGQHEHAPCPVHVSEDPVRRREWTIQRRNICRLFGESDHHPHYRQLKTLLHPLIAQLSDTIDRNKTPRSGPW
ncbi:hypothetical protein [Streptomyces sp. KR55]|uniref:hypothetical protein n=1 Tax=Streptomyces sp. KR55 TaxID=3457425 RepID=UPI003FD321E3